MRKILNNKSKPLYTPVPVMNQKQMRLTKHYKFIRYTNYLLQAIGTFTDVWLFLQLSPEAFKAMTAYINKKQSMINVMIYLWLTCMVVAVVFSLFALTIMRLTKLSVITFWGHWLVKNDRFFDDETKLKRAVADASTNKNITSFKAMWIFNIVLTILTFILIAKISTSSFMLSMAKVWLIAIIIDGLFNFWVQVVFDDLHFAIAEISEEEIDK